MPKSTVMQRGTLEQRCRASRPVLSRGGTRCWWRLTHNKPNAAAAGHHHAPAPPRHMALVLHSFSSSEAPPSSASPAPPQPSSSADDADPHARAVLHAAACAADAPLPDALRALFPGAFATMTSARKACRRRRVLVDGRLGGCGTAVRAGQLLQVLEPLAAEAEGPSGSMSAVAGEEVGAEQQQQQQQRQQRSKRQRAPPPGLEIPVLYDDDHISVVVKPYGLKCHATWGTHNLASYVRALVPPSRCEDALPGGPSPAHRLDRLTGGVLVLAKTKSAAASLTVQFEQRLVRKRYRAIVAGRLEQPTHLQHGEAGLSSQQTPAPGAATRPRGGEEAAPPQPPLAPPLIIDHPIEGRAARTELSVAAHSRCLKFGGWVTTVDLRPTTGRRHQLRRHLATCLGHPILGDPLYTPWARGGGVGDGEVGAVMGSSPDELRRIEEERRRRGGGGGSSGSQDGAAGEDGSGSGGANGGPQLLQGWGMALWAAELEFRHPATGEGVKFAVPEPPRFEKLRAQQAARWRKFNDAG